MQDSASGSQALSLQLRPSPGYGRALQHTLCLRLWWITQAMPGSNCSSHWPRVQSQSSFPSLLERYRLAMLARLVTCTTARAPRCTAHKAKRMARKRLNWMADDNRKKVGKLQHLVESAVARTLLAASRLERRRLPKVRAFSTWATLLASISLPTL